MNTEDFVTYEQAVALKKLGFREDIEYYFSEFKKITHSSCINNFNGGLCIMSAPTLAQAQKWLRSKGYSVEPRSWARNYKFYIAQIETCRDITLSDSSYSSYEETLSAGITECLKLLENIENGV